ncbi:MAG TPA: hypothetical protein VD704_03360 [Gaiellaceae bacterium]|nr:hypothetical protein [Gaiellaceae bacterium]
MEPAGVRVQGLAINDQVLALARLAETRSGSGDFTPKAVDELFHELRLPGPAKPHNNLVALEKKRLVRRGSGHGLWRVTPRGKAVSEAVVSGMDLAALQAEAATAGARLGGAAHPVILPEFGAPPELVPILRDFLAKHDFSHNVFGMTRFPTEGSDAPPDPIRNALDVAREVCAVHSLEFHLASDGQLHDDLWTNVAAYMWASRYGVAFVEDLAEPPKGLNYNLTAEVGSMLITGRRCCLLKDPSIESLPTDFVGRIRKDVDLAKPAQVAKALHVWIRDDLQLGPCPSCPS